mmetsp:Transcript_12307/g.37028  ORF Transcript_12307/g.37028 Transcript_12307/m.37028 type:complete len:235 (-) Transcript_12307:2631-3335(-)
MPAWRLHVHILHLADGVAGDGGAVLHRLLPHAEPQQRPGEGTLQEGQRQLSHPGLQHVAPDQGRHCRLHLRLLVILRLAAAPVDDALIVVVGRACHVIVIALGGPAQLLLGGRDGGGPPPGTPARHRPLPVVATPFRGLRLEILVPGAGLSFAGASSLQLLQLILLGRVHRLLGTRCSRGLASGLAGSSSLRLQQGVPLASVVAGAGSVRKNHFSVQLIHVGQLLSILLVSHEV